MPSVASKKISIDSFSLWICVAILLGAAFISMLYMQDDSLYADERITISHLGNLTSHYTLWETTQSIAADSEQHAPMYFWLLNIWSHFTGFSQVALRYFAVLIGFLSIAVMFRVMWLWYGKQAALYAMGLLGASALNLYYFHEMRMYSLITLLALLIMWQYTRILREQYQPSRWDWFSLFAAVTAIIYTHYFAIFPLIGFGVYHLLFVKKNRRWIQVSAAFILAGVMFLPWVRVVMAGMSEVTGVEFDGASFTELIYSWVWLVGNSWLPLMGVVLIGLVLGLRDRRVSLPVVMTVVVFIGLWLLNATLGILPIRRSRYFLILLPYLLMIIGYGLARIPRWRIVMPVLLIMWFVAGYQLHYSDIFELHTNRLRYQQSDFPPFPQITSAFIRDDAIETPDDLVLMVTQTSEHQGVTGPEPAYIAEYYWRQINVAGRVIEPWTFSDRARDEYPTDYRRSVDYVLSLEPLVTYLGYEPDKLIDAYHNQILERLNSDYQPCGALEQSEDLYLESFVRYPAPCQIISPPNVNIGFEEEPIRLRQAVMSQRDHQVVMVTGWSMDGDMPVDAHSYSLRVVNETGDYVATHDNGIPLALDSFGEPAGIIRRDLIVFDADDWQPGTYELRLVVYLREAVAPLTVNGAEANEANEVLIGTFDFPLADDTGLQVR